MSEHLDRQWKRREDSYCGQNDTGRLSLLRGKPVGNQQSESRAEEGARSRYENQFRNGERSRFHRDDSAFGDQLAWGDQAARGSLPLFSSTACRGRIVFFIEMSARG